MSATPEQIAIDEKALEAAAIALIDHDPSISGHHPIHVDYKRPIARAAIAAYLFATKDAQAERVRVLEAKLEKIAGEAPAKEPIDCPSVAWPPNWSDDLRDTVNDMILDAFRDGYTHACWRMGQIADAAALIRAQSEREKVLVEALKKLSFAAQTSGGTAGRDEALVAAIDHASAIIAKATGAPQ